MKRVRAPEADVEGSPHLVLCDDDREAIAELLAELILAKVAGERDLPE